MELTDKEFETFKKWLKGHIQYGPTTVVFTKKDGTERTMLCTTNPEMIPQAEESEEPKKQRKVNEETLAVYDLEAEGWRSFRWDSVKEVKFGIT